MAKKLGSAAGREKVARYRKASAAWHAARDPNPPTVKHKGRACAKGLFIKRLDHDANWRRASDREWRIYETSATHCGRIVGARVIHGKRRLVLSVGGRFFAQEPNLVFKQKGTLNGAKRRKGR